MNRLNIRYSHKNIQIPSRLQYSKYLVEKTENFLSRLHWKLFHIQHPGLQTKQETFGFKTNRSPPQVNELKPFTNDLLDLISNIQYRPVRNDFQSELKKDCSKITSSPHIILKGDKSNNLYEIPVADYKTVITNSITADYKKCSEDEVRETNFEALSIAKKLELEDRIETFSKSEAHVLVKDHKDQFPHRIQYRLINPEKSKIGIISKQILTELVSSLSEITGLNLWRNSKAVLNWFSLLQNKQKLTFFKFDVCSFYPSISEELFAKAIDFARSKVTITDEQVKILWHSRKSFLFSRGDVWTKKTGTFDVTMGSYDGAEVCELVGLYLLTQLEEHIPKEQLGLYRDDGLAAVALDGPGVERLRKQVIKLFKENGLKLTVEANLKSTDFLDITFDLNSSSFRPYRKETSAPLYIDVNSNHPRNIIKQLPSMVSERLSMLSSNQEIFNAEKLDYQAALKSAGYKEDLLYTPDRSNHHQRRLSKARSRRILWFNPPYNAEVSTNIGRRFLSLIERHFPVGSPLHKHFNKHTIKISYSCMPKVSSVIAGHNKKLFRQDNFLKELGCNCRGGKDTCPLNGKCQTESLVYKAIVTSPDNTTAEYIGQASTSFKARFNTSSFRNQQYSKNTALSSHFWNVKNTLNQPPTIDWSIVSLALTYKTETV